MERRQRPRACFVESGNQVEGTTTDAFTVVLFGDFIPLKCILYRDFPKALVGRKVVGCCTIWKDQDRAFGGGGSEFVVTITTSYESVSFLNILYKEITLVRFGWAELCQER